MARLVTKVLDAEQAEKLVSRSRSLRWEGYDIIAWGENPKAFYLSTGRFRRGMPAGRGWGIEHRYPVRPDGTWEVRVPA